MDVSSLSVFVEVARLGSFSSAARQLQVSPSYVSRHIAALEDEMGARLFHRTTRRVVLTEAGQAYYEHVAPLLEDLQHAAQRARDAHGSVRGLLRVSTPTSFAHEHVVPWIAELKDLHPDLRIELVLSPRMADLVEERIDVAIRLGRLQPSSLIASKLCEMPRVVVASPGYLAASGHPERPEDLAQHACLAFPFEGFAPEWSLRDATGREARVALTPHVTVPEGLVLRSLALQGSGLALLPRWLVAQQLREGALVDVFPGHEATATAHDAALWLVYPTRDYLPMKARAFLDYVKGQFRDGPPWERSAR